MNKLRIILAAGLLVLLSGAALAQIGLGGLGGGLGAKLPGGLNTPLNTPLNNSWGTINRATGRLDQDLHNTVQTARDLVGRPADSARLLGRDDRGAAVVRNQVLAVSPSDASLAIARQFGFSVAGRDQLDALGLSSVTLRAPNGMDAVSALNALRQADPQGVYDYAHIYNPAGDRQSDGAESIMPLSAASVRIGMIDGAIERQHPALSHADITAQEFAGKAGAPGSSHGTAIASLLVGKERGFSGYLPAGKLFAADVFGGAANGGSAADIARALNWMAANKIAVTNISLAGPPNALLAAAVKAFLASGHALVAPVGNDGPAAPPNYPAAYPGVIAVTSVDARGNLQIDANRGYARYAAQGVNVRAANLPGGYANVTGTSYATPAVSAHLATLIETPDVASVHDAIDKLQPIAVPIQTGDGSPLLLVR
ncbi:MAG TPA: S8 family serine peptidase [Rhizomicrobium sp.]|nr:S8 family serine peptidase [Rhizomicrobium sp.]